MASGSSSALSPSPAPPSIAASDGVVLSVSNTPLRPASPAKRSASVMDDSSSSADPDEISSRPSSDIVMVEAPSPTRPVSSSMNQDYDIVDNSTGLQPLANGSASGDASPPSFQVQCQLIDQDLETEPAEGTVGYLVSTSWINKIRAHANGAPAQLSGQSDNPVGPLDNSDIMLDSTPTLTIVSMDEPITPIRSGLSQGEHFSIFTEAFFKQLVAWYGIVDPSHKISRVANKASSGSESEDSIRYEPYPPIFTIRAVKANGYRGPPSDVDAAAVRIIAPVNTRYNSFLKRIKGLLDIPFTTKIRLWTSSSTGAGGSPSSDPSSKLPLLVEQADFDGVDDKNLMGFSDSTAIKNYNGRLDLQTVELVQDCTVFVEPSQSTMKPTRVESSPSSLLSPKGALSNGVAHADTQTGSKSGIAGSSKRTQRTKKYHPNAGLTNLGNTCYMNSALQCLRSVEELSVFFLSGKSRGEINYSNPLGFKGNVANRYSELLMGMFGTNGVFRPSSFRNTVSHHWVGMQPWQQQDTQEFLSFLTDGLHEDLNRIVNKPYIEYPDSDNFDLSDPKSIEILSAKYSDIYAARNDSIVMDLFHGFYKNTLVCPDCSKISVMFDPFTSVTLQLPQSQSYTLVYIPLVGTPVKLEIEADRGFTVRNLKEKVAQQIPGSDPSSMLMADVHAHSIYRVFQDNGTLMEYRIRDNDTIFMYQLDAIPNNYPPKSLMGRYRPRSMLDLYGESESDTGDEKTPSSESRLFYAMSRIRHSVTGHGQLKPGSYPILITLTPQEARSAQTIKKKILMRIAQLTTLDLFSQEACEKLASLGSSEEDDQVDAAPSPPSSSQGEPEAVQMNTISGNLDPSLLLDENVLLPTVLDNLFDIRVTRSFPSIIPPESARYGMIDTVAHAVPLSEREKAIREKESPVLPLDEGSKSAESTSSDEELEGEVSNRPSPPSKLNDSSSSEAEAPPSSYEPSSFKQSRARDFERKAKRKGGGKFASRFGAGRKQDRSRRGGPPFRSVEDAPSSQLRLNPEVERSEGEDGGDLLVKNGELLVVEWKPEVFAALFGGRPDAPGRDSIARCDYLPDPVMERQRQLRQRKQKSVISLQECFTETTKTEVLSQENAWYCNACKDRRRASKTLEIWTLPDVLVLHLKRFHATGTSRQKLSTHVDFPLEGLDLNGLVGKKDGRDYTYDLIAIDNHYGDLGGGHYTAYAKSFLDGQWYDFNDSSVRVVHDPKSMVTPSAYLLFYRRRSTDPLGPPYLQDLVNRFRSGGLDPLEDQGEGDQQQNQRNGNRVGDAGNKYSPESSPDSSPSSSGGSRSNGRRSFFSRGLRSLGGGGASSNSLGGSGILVGTGAGSGGEERDTTSNGTTNRNRSRELTIRNLPGRATRRIRRLLSSDSEETESVAELSVSSSLAAGSPSGGEESEEGTGGLETGAVRIVLGSGLANGSLGGSDSGGATEDGGMELDGEQRGPYTEVHNLAYQSHKLPAYRPTNFQGHLPVSPSASPPSEPDSYLTSGTITNASITPTGTSHASSTSSLSVPPHSKDLSFQTFDDATTGAARAGSSTPTAPDAHVMDGAKGDGLTADSLAGSPPALTSASTVNSFAASFSGTGSPLPSLGRLSERKE